MQAAPAQPCEPPDLRADHWTWKCHRLEVTQINTFTLIQQ